MIAVDTNILVYAHREDAPWHDAADARMRELAEGRAAWAIPWSCVHEFVAIVTHPRIYRPPTPLALALEQVDAWLDSPTVSTIGESGDHWPVLRALIEGGRLAGGQIHDARVAAVCLAHGVTELWTVDRDFSRYPALRIRNPLA
ncbi:MAG TPA: TA system VapC family ribonuclease toxin [Vicinamibacterales bacterium]|nr:TA system VapC family ribonuclease toxin [Vicinamibacterales bacterium]